MASSKLQNKKGAQIPLRSCVVQLSLNIARAKLCYSTEMKRATVDQRCPNKNWTRTSRPGNTYEEPDGFRYLHDWCSFLKQKFTSLSSSVEYSAMVTEHATSSVCSKR